MGFLESRRALIFRPEGLYVQGEGDTRRGKDWCLGDLALSEEVWSAATRGYMTKDRVVFFRGTEYEPCLDMTQDQIDTAVDAQRAFYDTKGDIPVYTGVVPGEPGSVWAFRYRHVPKDGSWELLESEGTI